MGEEPFVVQLPCRDDDCNSLLAVTPLGSMRLALQRTLCTGERHGVAAQPLGNAPKRRDPRRDEQIFA